MKKRLCILSLLLAVCLLFAVCTVALANDDPNVARIGDNYYLTLEDAFAAAQDGDTVTMLKSVELKDAVVITKEITLDLNNCSITGVDIKDSADKAVFHVKEADGTLKFEKHSFRDYKAKKATCVSAGNSAYSKCTDCKYTIGYEEYPALGHSYGTATYTWDGNKCTASRDCTVCAAAVSDHNQTEVAVGEYVKDTDATCLTCEKGHYKVTFKNEAFTEQETAKDSVDNGSPLGHSYGSPIYSWSGKECTATRTCIRCTEGTDGHVDSETVTGTYVKDTEASCTEPEKGHYKATFTNAAFTEQETAKDSADNGSPLGHSYGTPDYSWVGDKCTASRACTRCEEGTDGHVDSETVTGTYVKDTDATCTTCEKGHYTASFKSEVFEPQVTATNSADHGSPLGHSYGTATYTWDGNRCTASRDCTVCQQSVLGHNQTEVVVAEYVKDTDATCLVCEKGHYKATFANEAFAEQTTAKDSVDNGSPLGHSYGTPDYSWSGKECTATRECVNCAEGTSGHSESETVTGTYAKDASATCTVCEKGHYEANFTKPCFEQQKTAANSVSKGDPTGHSYDSTEYIWTGDKCTATRICKICSADTTGHVDTETVTGTYVKDSSATCTVCEKGHYEASFKNQDFAAQRTASRSVDNGDPLGHSYGTATYTWDGNKCTASRDCTVCAAAVSDHNQTEVAVGEYVKDTDATCLTCEKGHYKVTFKNEAFTEQETAKDSVDNGSPLGHSYGSPIYSWSGKECTATRTCIRCTEGTDGHVDSETVTGTYVKDTEASCTEPEKGHYKATFTNAVFTEQETAKDSADNGSPLGHSYGTPDYSWVGDKCTASRACTRCEEGTDGHVDSETVTGTYVKDTDATCTVCEKGHYKATFTNAAFTEQETEKDSVDNGSPLGHSYGDPEFTWDVYACSAKVTCHCGDVQPVKCDVQEKISIEPACTVDGIKSYTAVVEYNGAVYTDVKYEVVPATGHVYNIPKFSWTDGYICTARIECKCGVYKTASCKVENEVTREPSCALAGERTYTASFTYEGVTYTGTKTASIDKKPHTPGTAVVENEVKPTCMDAGTYDEVVYCSECREELQRTGKSTDALGHDIVHHDAKDPTCTEDGWLAYDTCSRCTGYSTKVVIPKNGHSYESSVVDPTCTERGYTRHTCTVCTYSYDDTYVDAHGHKFGTPEFEWAPDHSSATATAYCDYCGWQTYQCTVTDTIAEDATCVKDGTRVFSASVNMGTLYNNIVTETIPAKGHDFAPTVVDPTCTRGGYTHNVCNRCKASKDSDITPPLGHQYETSTVEATCTEQGYTTHVCARCSDTYTDSYINALGHNYKNGICTRCKDGMTVLDVPTVSASNNTTTGKIKLTWDKVEKATKYEVYRSTTEKGTYSKLGSSTGLTYTNTSAKAGTTYYYKVRAIAADGSIGDFSESVKRCCDCAKPVVKASNVSSSGKIKLTWDKVEGATKYEVYRATSKTGTYSKLGTTTGTSYTNSSATVGKTYYYKVKAICSNSSGNSAYSEIVSRCCDCAKPTVKITTSSGHPKLTWGKVTGADKYIVYRATSKSGTYSKLYTTTKTSYTNTSAKAGKTYYYKVVAVSNKTTSANSAYSSIVSIKAK